MSSDPPCCSWPGGITLTVQHGYGPYFMLAGTLTAFLGAV